MPSKRPPWGWRGDGRAGSAYFFREMTGSRNREKNYGGVTGGWFPGTIVAGWRDREEIIARTGIRDLFRGLLYQGISTVITGFCQLYWYWETGDQVG